MNSPIKSPSPVSYNMGYDECTLLDLLDLSAAFDSVDRDILPSRLQRQYGIDGTAVGYIVFDGLALGINWPRSNGKDT